MKKKILIVEDDISLRDALNEKLTDLNYEFLNVSKGEGILSVIKDYQPDLILLDLVLPEKNGFEILEELKVKNKILTPVIILTNLNSQEEQKRGRDLGAIDYILKSDTSLKDIGTNIGKVLA